jgi:hypothetical protein
VSDRTVSDCCPDESQKPAVVGALVLGHVWRSRYAYVYGFAKLRRWWRSGRTIARAPLWPHHKQFSVRRLCLCAAASRAALAPPPVRNENVFGRRADAGEAWCGNESSCDSVAQEPVEPLIAAKSAKARLISGRLLPAAIPPLQPRRPSAAADNRARSAWTPERPGRSCALGSLLRPKGFTSQPRVMQWRTPVVRHLLWFR